MSKDQSLIPAVGYLRKSTKGLKADGSEKQEKSIEDQTEDILKHAKGRFKIIRWYKDPGVSGWKREAARPDFAKMLADAK
jgi:DNA invertase Pin-like site-specific DNA recombinase